MFKNLVFQLHWLLGITAGVVLAVVGVTGAMLSFEHGILKAINPGVMTVEARPAALPPAELLARVGAQWPDRAIQSLALSADAEDAARVSFAPAPGSVAPGGRARGETRYVDPYTGALLPAPRGQGFFRTTMQIHRWLAADAVGKQIVGASTISLVFFCLSGLYLRWPRKWLDWRAWLKLDWAQKGRSFLWHLHSVVGTWVLAAYLVMSLTGLFWSYDWYRSGLYAITGTPVPAGRGGPAPPGGSAPRGADGAAATRAERASPLDTTALFAAFDAAVPARSVVTLRLPGAAGQPAEFSYQDPDPPHGRANNRLVLDAATGAVVQHERYDDKPTGQRLMASMLPLHSGEYFGLAGLVLFMLASLLMPLFTISGWMLYLDRRRKKAAVRAAATAGPSAEPAMVAAGDDVLVAHASQTGTAERLAWQTAASLRSGGLGVRVVPLASLDADTLASTRRLLVVASTFGEGEPPDALRAFSRRVLGRDVTLPRLQYAVLALGDRSYDAFCAFGHAVDRWLHRQGATPLFDAVEVDDGDPGALRRWQHHLSVLSGSADLPDWRTPAYRDAVLLSREHLNPGSPGGPVHLLALQPPRDETWQAGDIAEIGPRHAEAEVARWLAASGHRASAPVQWQDKETTLGAALAAAQLPAVAPLAGLPAQAVADVLVPLPHREYSIASLPGDGRLELLVRRMQRADGRPGLGSGWLTMDAPVGGAIALRVRANPNFHPPADDRPLVLVGNGTGIAGLHALLRARIAAGHRRNWLLFGERTAAHDFHFRERLAAAQAGGFLPHLDLAFSRDGGGRVYVQDRLREQADRLRAWIADGAAIHVCGSLEGMAPGVESVLAEVLGAGALDHLADAGRYRRDVY
jgi:sulfite reductase (NADPH) flavoprotein alpha-component